MNWIELVELGKEALWKLSDEDIRSLEMELRLDKDICEAREKLLALLKENKGKK